MNRVGYDATAWPYVPDPTFPVDVHRTSTGSAGHRPHEHCDRCHGRVSAEVSVGTYAVVIAAMFGWVPVPPVPGKPLTRSLNV